MPAKTKLPVPDDVTGPERVRLRRKLWYQSKKKAVLKKREKWNRAQGHKKRPPDGPHVQKRVTVSQTRRYVFIAGKAYFNSSLGFDVQELSTILTALIADRNKLAKQK